MTQNGDWGAQNASKLSENITKTPPKYPQTHLETFFLGHFSPQIARKRLSPQAPPLQATRPLVASQRVIKDPKWSLEDPKCVKTIRKHHKYPPKVSPNTFGKFFSGHFSPQIAQKRLSPPGRLLGIRPTASARENRYFGHKSGSGAANSGFFWLIGCGITVHNF